MELTDDDRYWITKAMQDLVDLLRDIRIDGWAWDDKEDDYVLSTSVIVEQIIQHTKETFMGIFV